jgi:hypothetical protein
MSKIEKPKSMDMFFIDNRASFTSEAVLAGDLILAPDDGVYPRAVPVASATHPAFDGRVVVMAGNRTLVVALVHGAKSDRDVQTIMSAMPKSAKEGRVNQYVVALDPIVHRVVSHAYQEQEGDVPANVTLGKILVAMATEHPTETDNLRIALRHALRHGKEDLGMTPDVWQSLSEMAEILDAEREA